MRLQQGWTILCRHNKYHHTQSILHTVVIAHIIIREDCTLPLQHVHDRLITHIIIHDVYYIILS